jgi:hypothetical protein
MDSGGLVVYHCGVGVLKPLPSLVRRSDPMASQYIALSEILTESSTEYNNM